jgi:outer membrane protein assembly factor BamD (BamD/ComL family)
MKKYCILLVMAVSIYGCAAFQKNGKTFEFLFYAKSQADKLETARKLLRDDRVQSATQMLVSICSAKGVPGVTDEALFRLSLIYLDAGQTKNDISQAQDTLEKLMRDYPTSSWSPHAAALVELIATLNRKIKSLKGENLTLEKKNRELRLNIEKLKILDIEQDQKIKR